MNPLIENIYTNCTPNPCSEEILHSVFFKNECEFQDSKFPNEKIILNLPENKQKPIIEVKTNNFFIIPKFLYVQSNIKNIELYENEEYIKTIRGEQITIESNDYYVHKYEFNSNKNAKFIKVKFISSPKIESFTLYNFYLNYETSNNSIKENPSQDDISIDFNNVREMLSGIQISDDAQKMLNNIESNSKMFNSLLNAGMNLKMGNFNSSEVSSSSNSSSYSSLPFGNMIPPQPLNVINSKVDIVTNDKESVVLLDNFDKSDSKKEITEKEIEKKEKKIGDINENKNKNENENENENENNNISKNISLADKTNETIKVTNGSNSKEVEIVSYLKIIEKRMDIIEAKLDLILSCMNLNKDKKCFEKN